jgi:hypothetical protein
MIELVAKSRFFPVKPTSRQTSDQGFLFGVAVAGILTAGGRGVC